MAAGAIEAAANGGRGQPRIDAGEEDGKMFGDEIRDAHALCGKELGFDGFCRE
jgi:hypothetical protein